jgi:hypothetical protein
MEWWGVVYDQSADHLLVKMKRWDLVMLTPEGETTWRRGT